MADLIRPAGCGWSTELPDMDFETYSEAGYVYDATARRWRPMQKNKRNGLEIVGAPVYAEHPTTEILSLAYDLKDGRGPRLWTPDRPAPGDLFDHIRGGGLIEAWNCLFEFWIWEKVASARMGWPLLPLEQLRDAMAKARAHGLPGALEHATAALGTPLGKIADGKRLLTKFSKPRNPTKKDDRLRIYPGEDPEDAARLYEYNVGDIAAEAQVSARCPDLSPFELEIWQLDQRMNVRGVQVDIEAAENLEVIVNAALARGAEELVDLTRGKITEPTQVKAITEWAQAEGAAVTSLADAALQEALAGDLPPHVRRVLEIRAALGSASVKKLTAMRRTVSADGRIRDLFSYCGAERTGRWAGRGVQPQNLTNGGPDVLRCACGRHYGTHRSDCPWCGRPAAAATRVEWGLEAATDALYVAEARSVDLFEMFFGDPLVTIAGCLRALFCAAPGKELICSDFAAIEAVVLAALAGEEWRMEVFRTHGKIYEMSAAKITGVPFEEFLRHKRETGEHHPLRKKVGKVAELASGYQGWIGAWKAFGADKHFTDDDEIKQAVLAWRAESPWIVAFWAALENAAKAAVKNPGTVCQAVSEVNGMQVRRDISYAVKGDVLYCRLPSGRLLSYHKPMITPGTTPWGAPSEDLSFMGWNSDYTKGPKAWLRMETWGGKLTENVTQATARDIFACGFRNVEHAQYPVVLQVHDELISEIPAGFGSVEEYERLMSAVPAWCADWPVRASGGWRGFRYRKD